MALAFLIDIKQGIVQLQWEGLILWEIVNRLKVSVGVVHEILKIQGEYRKYNPSKKQIIGQYLGSPFESSQHPVDIPRRYQAETWSNPQGLCLDGIDGHNLNSFDHGTPAGKHSLGRL